MIAASQSVASFKAPRVSLVPETDKRVFMASVKSWRGHEERGCLKKSLLQLAHQVSWSWYGSPPERVRYLSSRDVAYGSAGPLMGAEPSWSNL